MLQWMGGSRRKVTTSRKSTQKRQKQYFEQRKRQQQYQQQTAGLDNYDNEMDTSEEHNKEHRSLDVISLLNLSKISQECRSACPSVFPSCTNALGRKNVDVDASKVEFDISDGSVVTQSGSVVQPDDFVQFKEARIPSADQLETRSPKKVSCSARDNQINITKPYQRETHTEQPLSVLALLVDDEMNANMEGNIIHEDHVAFSVEGLGKVGTETPVHSPQQPSRAFPYSFSSAMKASGQLNLSTKFNCLLDDLETEVDARMQDFNLPLDTNHLDFSSDYMNSLSSSKQKSFTFRDERLSHGHSSKKNRYFDPHNEDKWDDGYSFQFDSCFDQKDSDTSWKTRQSRIDDIVADNLIHRAHNTPDFAFEEPHIPIRDEKVTEKFDNLGSTLPFSKLDTSEYDNDFFNSKWSRQPAVERKFDCLHETHQPGRFTVMQEDARENSSLHSSEESCSSTAVRNQAIDDSLSNATSRHCMRRGYGNSCFPGSGSKYGTMKPFAKECKNESRPVNTKMLDHPDLKAKHQSSSFFQENLEAKDNWLFEKTCTEADINPGFGFCNQNPGTKQTRFDSDVWDEDPFCKSPKMKISTDHQHDGFCYEPAGLSSSEYFTFTPAHMNIPPRASPVLSKPGELSLTSGNQGEIVSPDISVQESISKDIKSDTKSEQPNYETFELQKEVFSRNEAVVSEGKVATEASNSTSNGCNSTEAKDQTTPQSMERTKMVFLPDLVEDITNKSGNPNHEKDRIGQRNGDHDGAYKSPRPYQSRKRENMEEFGAKDRMGYKQKSNYFGSPRQTIMLQSYVFQLFSVQKRLY